MISCTRNQNNYLVTIYSKDLEPDIDNYIIQFKTIMKHFSKKKNIHAQFV